MVKSVVKMALKGAGRMAGEHAGRMVGNAASGGKAGSMLGAKLSRLIGTGDYAISDGVEENTLFSSGTSRGASANATFASTTGGLRLKHREFLNDVYSGPLAGVFSNVSFSVNPGLSTVFPFLSQIAANYEQYRFHGLVFEFISSTAPYGVTSLGTYVMAMEYNAAAPAFTSKPQIENSDYALSARLDKCGMYGVECAAGQQAQEFLYVRAPGQATPVNLTDLGLMQFVTVPGAGIAVNSALGELWVSYDIELVRPRISAARYGYFHNYGTGADDASPLGLANASVKAYGALAGVTVTGTNVINFVGGSVGDTYYMTITWVGAVGVANTAPALTLAGCEIFYVLNGLASAQVAAGNTVISNTMILECYVTVTAEAPLTASITVAKGSAIPAGSCDVVIVDVGNGFQPGSL